MTGPEHYREAERLLELADRVDTAEVSARLVPRAQAHATLALVAAQVDTHAVLFGTRDWPDAVRS